MAELPHGFQLIQDCEAAIGRMRAAIRDGRSDDAAVGEDWEFIQQAVRPRFVAYARKLHWMGAHVFEEALNGMYDRLLDNIWSPTFPSLETGFGRYLHDMPKRVLQETARKYRPAGVSEIIERLDQPLGEDGMARHELVEDRQAAAAFDVQADREDLRQAIARLPALEREVISLRLAEVDNGTIAQRLGVAPATATRIWQRAVEMLRQMLNPPEE